MLNLRLYTAGYPNGRCLLLAIRLEKLVRNGRGLEIAQRLFSNQYSHDKPVEVNVVDPTALEELQATCAEFGITLETTEL